jgi:hypothetical protein
MSDQESASDDLSGLTGFFFYMFIVHPFTGCILRPIAFLAALAAVKTGEFLNVISVLLGFV